MVFALPLLAMVLLPSPVSSAPGGEKIMLDPETGPVDSRVRVKGRHFDDYEGQDVWLFFSSDKAAVGDSAVDLSDGEWLRTVEVDDGDFIAYFDVPREINDDVSPGTGYVSILASPSIVPCFKAKSRTSS